MFGLKKLEENSLSERIFLTLRIVESIFVNFYVDKSSLIFRMIYQKGKAFLFDFHAFIFRSTIPFNYHKSLINHQLLSIIINFKSKMIPTRARGGGP